MKGWHDWPDYTTGASVKQLSTMSNLALSYISRCVLLRHMGKIDELLAGTIDVVVMPDGRLKAKGDGNGLGMDLVPKTFY